MIFLIEWAGMPLGVVIFVKAPEAFVPEPPDDHEALYGITVHPSSDFQRREKARCRAILRGLRTRMKKETLYFSDVGRI